MRTNNKEWFSIMQEHTDLSSFDSKYKINHLSYLPTVILDYEGELYTSKLTKCRRINKGILFSEDRGITVFDFEFEAFGKRIKEECVFHIDLALKLDDHDYFTITSSKAIMESKDYDDHWMIIYKNPINCPREQVSDIVVYHNMVKQFTITNVFGYINNRYQSPQKMSYISFEPIFTFQRLKNNDYRFYDAEHIDKWILMNGVQYREDKIKLSLSTWDENLSPSRNSLCKAINNYSPANRIPVEKISCNSIHKVKWRCYFGHEWLDRVYKITSKNEFSSFCPICEKIIPSITFNRDEIEIQSIIALYKFIMRSLNITKVENIHKTIMPLYEDTNRLFIQNKDQSMNKWLYTPDNITVYYYFSYPNGKASEIDMYISENYGSVEEIEPFLYKATFSSKNKDKLVLLDAYPAGINVINPFNPIGKECYDNDIYNQYQYMDFMFKYNVFYRYMMLCIIKNSFEKKGSIIFPYQYYYNEMRDFDALLRKERKEIYNQIVFDGKSLGKWKSEQALYSVVKHLFNDAVYQYHASWLGNQSLDIYIPCINVGIEYQGIQHYEAVDYFGGKDAFLYRKDLDAKKRRLCKQNNVQLIEWKYTKAINLENAKEALKLYINE